MENTKYCKYKNFKQNNFKYNLIIQYQIHTYIYYKNIHLQNGNFFKTFVYLNVNIFLSFQSL